MEFRPASPEDTAELTALRWRSKAYWGYPAEWVRRVEGEVCVPHPSADPKRSMFVLERDGAMMGFYSLIRHDSLLMELDDFFLDTPFIARGLGRKLWDDAVRRSRASGHARLKIIADPNAEGFYLAQGARREGEVVSRSDASRILPVLFYDLSDFGRA